MKNKVNLMKTFHDEVSVSIAKANNDWGVAHFYTRSSSSPPLIWFSSMHCLQSPKTHVLWFHTRWSSQQLIQLINFYLTLNKYLISIKHQHMEAKKRDILKSDDERKLNLWCSAKKCPLNMQISYWFRWQIEFFPKAIRN